VKPDLNSSEARFSVELVSAAAKLASRVRDENSYAPHDKEDHTPVTIADMGIQALAGSMLTRYFPDGQLVAEENADELRKVSGASRLEAISRYVQRFTFDATPEKICDWIDRGRGFPQGTFWTLDPIDGTRGYLNGRQYATALALIREGQVTLAAIGCPELELPGYPMLGKGVMLFAEKGKGCWAASFDKENWVKLSVSQCSEIRNASILDSYDPDHKNNEKNDWIRNELGIEKKPIPLDSQAKHVVLVAGCAEIFFRTLPQRNPGYREKIWDVAPGAFVIEEAGGRVTDLNGQPIDYGTGEVLKNNIGILATNGLLHSEVLRATQKTVAGLS